MVPPPWRGDLQRGCCLQPNQVWLRLRALRGQLSLSEKPGTMDGGLTGVGVLSSSVYPAGLPPPAHIASCFTRSSSLPVGAVTRLHASPRATDYHPGAVQTPHHPQSSSSDPLPRTDQRGRTTLRMAQPRRRTRSRGYGVRCQQHMKSEQGVASRF